MTLEKLSKRMMGLAFLGLLISLTGCARLIVIHALTPEDYFIIPKGTKVGEYTTEKDGQFISHEVIKEVVGAKLEK